MIKNELKDGFFSIGSFDDEPDDISFWLNKSAEERIEAVEFLRRQFYPYGKAEQEFRRFLEITDRKES